MPPAQGMYWSQDQDAGIMKRVSQETNLVQNLYSQCEDWQEEGQEVAGTEESVNRYF